ncbi:SIR2 family NAD-dependent protein deacylase [Nonlabens marinus]|uniref:NAD-dependent protein deacylase n=1 Tax=Nonlabens marinus S1-08 TaxID=1454201 RepID=W8VXH0_9FLAO|nr:NAD-dependent deacylase [Nonlabens marinus]BAO55912.1 NAD-dependent protein deacetylase of SIR2 family [Nonlabens marinus S1-08]
MKKIVVLSGAGVSAESGISTFRDAGGLWEGHDVMEVASPEGWQANPELVLDFYNKRRAQLKDVEPNAAHHCIAALERNYEVQVITQNVDDLHERAGSSQVLHLHGELRKARSSSNIKDIQEWTEDITIHDKCAAGSQMRPHIVWFGEEVPAMDEAIDWIQNADAVIVVGTSLQVYPAAGLMHYAPAASPIYLVDPSPTLNSGNGLTVIAENASTGIQKACDMIHADLHNAK